MVLRQTVEAAERMRATRPDPQPVAS
jgi:hypothetical protein